MMKQQISGDRIRELRQEMGLTQEEFARVVAVTFSTVNRWENGHAKPSKLARRALETLAGTLAGPATSSREAGAANHMVADLAPRQPTSRESH